MEYIKNIKQPTINDVRVVDPTPVWIGYENHSAIKHFMNTELAEKWLKEDPANRSLKMETTAGELRQHAHKQLNTSIWDR